MEEQEQDLDTVEEQEQGTEEAAEEVPQAPLAGEEEREAVDEVTALLQELEEAKKEQAEYLDGWQRARAELANARKRFQREQEQAYANARADVLVQMLPILDDFERALDTLPHEMEEEAWLGGIRLIWRKFQALLQQAGVSPIEAVGQEFDPYLHQAVTHEPSDTVPEGHVIDEMQKGYQMDGRVLRPSIVRVSAGRAEEPAAPQETTAAEEDDQAEAGGAAEAEATAEPGPAAS